MSSGRQATGSGVDRFGVTGQGRPGAGPAPPAVLARLVPTLAPIGPRITARFLRSLVAPGGTERDDRAGGRNMVTDVDSAKRARSRSTHRGAACHRTVEHRRRERRAPPSREWTPPGSSWRPSRAPPACPPTRPSAVISGPAPSRASGRRQAFRELGRSIGIVAGLRTADALPVLAAEEREGALRGTGERIRRHQGLRGEIEAFWMDPDHRRVEGWTAHREVSRVMLATSLAPGGYLGP